MLNLTFIWYKYYSPLIHFPLIVTSKNFRPFRDRVQILLLRLIVFKRVNQLLLPLKSSKNYKKPLICLIVETKFGDDPLGRKKAVQNDIFVDDKASKFNADWNWMVTRNSGLHLRIYWLVTQQSRSLNIGLIVCKVICDLTW